jgi:dTMP kinase
MKRGAFIVFEGLDRSGKSTQAAKLTDSLNESGIAFVSMR